jgi:hypothetical protein
MQGDDRPTQLLSSYSITVRSQQLHRSKHERIRRLHALSLPCSRCMCVAAHPSGGVDGGLATLQPTPTTQQTNNAFRCRHSRSDRTTASPSSSGHCSPGDYQVNIAHFETYPRKTRTTAYSTRPNSRRVRHSCLQAALEDDVRARGTRAYMIGHVLWL